MHTSSADVDNQMDWFAAMFYTCAPISAHVKYSFGINSVLKIRKPNELNIWKIILLNHYYQITFISADSA